MSEATEADLEAPRSGRKRRVAKWAFGIVGALLLLIAGAALLLNTPLGERFLADRIASQTLPNGLNIRIGRIEGNLYGRAVLHDVVLSDPQGPFATIPRAEVDWNPGAWVRNRLDIDEFTARRATLSRIPEFLPSEEDGPILPGFDIAIGKLEIDQLTLAEGIVGDSAEQVDLLAEVLVEDRRLFLDARGELGEFDRFAIDLDAEPDGDVFDLALDYRAPASGVVAGLLGAEAGYRARIGGDGTWSDWRGAAIVRRNDERYAALLLTNNAGTFALRGQVYPTGSVQGLLARALGQTVSIDATATIDNRVIDGTYEMASGGVRASAEGLVDLADNRFDDLSIDANVRDPALLGGDWRLEGARLSATLDGPMKDLSIGHELNVARLVSGSTVLSGISQSGTAQYDGTRWILPLDASVGRVETGSEIVDPRLVGGRVGGTLVLSGNNLLSDDLRIAFPDASANLALRGDLDRGLYGLSGNVRAQRLAFDDVGIASGAAKVDLSIGNAWGLRADLGAQLSPVTNGTLANLVGDPIRLRGGLAIGSAQPFAFNSLNIDAEKLQATLDGRVVGGNTTLAGQGRHTEYGPFTVEAQISDAGPEAELVFADPLPAAGLADVRVAIAPSEDGFQIDTSGMSLLGPFDGDLGLVAPAGGPTNIAVNRLTITDTVLSGDLILLDDGIAGDLAFTGGGVNGTIVLDPRAGGQGVDASLTARNASFGGETPIRIARANIDAQGLIEEGSTTFTAEASGQGLAYGSLFVGRFAAEGELRDGVGKIDASLAGRRGGSFRLDLTSGIAPDRITLAARGEFAGERIAMPRRAVLTSLEDGGWALQPTQLNFGEGGMIASGRFGGADTEVDLKLKDMPLSLIEIAVADIGLGGSISGLITYSDGAERLPSGSAKVRVRGLTRSGLVLSSRPIDLSLVGELSPERLELRSRFQNDDIQRGRLQTRISSLPAAGGLWERLRAGNLFGQLRFEGAAESVWRLAAISAFDLTGPIAIAADATGSLEDPQVRGSMRSDNLRIRSSLSGTDIRDVTARGRFAGSRLRLTSFRGTTPNGGSVSGSGIVDLAGLGEQVQGRFLEIRGPTLDLRAAADNARLVDNNGLSATITGPLRIVSNGLGGTIAGRVQINRASWRLGTAAEDVQLPRIATREVNVPDDVGPRAAAGRPWRYLIDARGSSRIDVDGLGLDSEWGADIILRGTTDDPRIGGEARVVRGDYTFAGTRFELTRGRIDFDENVPIDPRLDILAETDQDGLSVDVRVTGSAQQPEVSFSSDPALPEEEILSRLLFGGSITDLSETDALQLGMAVASLRGGAGIDPINQLRSAIGLDRLRIVGADPALDRGTGVALGKNITRRFYVEIVTDGRGYSATEVEFRVTSWLSLLAAVSTIGRESVIAEISRDY